MTKLKLDERKRIFLNYFILFFAYLMLYNLIYVGKMQPWHINDITYTYHLVDFKMGFVSSFFAGEIFHILFNGKVDPAQVTVFHVVLTVLLFLFVSFMLAQLVSLKENKKDRRALFIMSMFFISGPCTFALYTRLLGTLDVYFVYLAAMFVFFVSNKYLKYAVPALFVFAVMNHFSALNTVIILFSLVLLYKAACESEKARKGAYFGIFAASIVIGAAATFYLFSHGESNLAYDLNGFNEELGRRCVENKTDMYYDIYYDYSIYHYFSYEGENVYGIYPLEHFLPSIGASFPPAIKGLLENLLSHMRFNYLYYYANNMPYRTGVMIVLFFATLPIYVLFFGMWKRLIKQTKDKIKKFCFAMCIIQPVVTFIGGILFSGDVPRWAAFALLIQFTMAFFVTKYDISAFDYIKEKLSDIKLRYIVFYFLIYSCINYDPY